MENTGKVLFGNDTPQWYIALGDRWIGPLSAADVYQKILSQEVTWAHFVWKAGQPDWKRICDLKTFQSAVPSLPGKGILQEVKEASRPGIKTASPKPGARGSGRAAVAPPAPREKSDALAEERDWFLYYNDSQFGPFSGEEINRFLHVGKIHGRVHVWRDGMGEWARLETIAQFAEGVALAKKIREEKKAGATRVGAASRKELRSAPRRPLVAKILMANQESVIVAVCRDISVGGMQVLTDRVPGVAGARIKMNVSPAGKASEWTKSGEKEIEPFVAEGVIVRILEDGRGFSFRFDRLPESSKRAIEAYIHAISQ